MFDSIAIDACAFIAAVYALSPVAVRMTFDFAAHRNPTQIALDELPDEVAPLFRSRIPQIQALGFELIGCSIAAVWPARRTATPPISAIMAPMILPMYQRWFGRRRPRIISSSQPASRMEQPSKRIPTECFLQRPQIPAPVCFGSRISRMRGRFSRHTAASWRNMRKTSGSRQSRAGRRSNGLSAS
jgi:hypothetical protein